MIAVCLSHFMWSAVQTVGETKTFDRLIVLSMVASPTFILVSGITLGYMQQGGAEAYARFRAKLRDRAILLLTVAHVLMAPAFYYMAPSSGQAWRALPITDTIGVCLLLGPAIVERLSARGRVWLAAVLVAASWATIYAIPETAGVGVRIVENALVGFRRESWWFYSFPVVPWLGVYLFGTAVGQAIGREPAVRPNGLSVVLLRWAGAAAAAALLLGAATRSVARLFAGSPVARDVALRLGNPVGKVPPSPEYLLVYGSAGLVMTAAAATLIERGWLPWVTRRAIDIGRASLVVFVVQGYLYYLIELHWLPPRHLWPLMFAASLVIVYGVSRAWLAAGGNSLLRLPGRGAPSADATEGRPPQPAAP